MERTARRRGRGSGQRTPRRRLFTHQLIAAGMELERRRRWERAVFAHEKARLAHLGPERLALTARVPSASGKIRRELDVFGASDSPSRVLAAIKTHRVGWPPSSGCQRCTASSNTAFRRPQKYDGPRLYSHRRTRNLDAGERHRLHTRAPRFRSNTPPPHFRAALGHRGRIRASPRSRADRHVQVQMNVAIGLSGACQT